MLKNANLEKFVLKNITQLNKSLQLMSLFSNRFDQIIFYLFIFLTTKEDNRREGE